MPLRYLIIAASLYYPFISMAYIDDGRVGFVGTVISEGTCALAEPEHTAKSGNMSEREIAVTMNFKSCPEKLLSATSVSLHDASDDNKSTRFMYNSGKVIAKGQLIKTSEFVRKTNDETSLKLLFSHPSGDGKGLPAAVVRLTYD